MLLSLINVRLSVWDMPYLFYAFIIHHHSCILVMFLCIVCTVIGSKFICFGRFSCPCSDLSIPLTVVDQFFNFAFFVDLWYDSFGYQGF